MKYGNITQKEDFMDGKKVVIILGKDGSVRADASGFKGGSCEKATEFLDKMFGSKGKREFKSSYYEEDVVVDGLPSGYCG
jgi:hypothetical protein